MATSRLVALLNCLDPGATPDFTHGAVLPSLWSGGWPSFYSAAAVDHLWSDLGVGRFLLYAPFGIYAAADTKQIGASKSQAAINSVLLGPRQSETDLADDRLVDGTDTLPGFTTFWQGSVAALSGSEFICWQSAPPLATSTDGATLDAWVQEAETCNMNIGFDQCGDTDRLSFGTPVGLLADRLALRRRTLYVGQHALLDPRTNGWYDGRFPAASTKARADLLWAAPTTYGVPAGGEESVVFLTAAVTADPAARLELALQWMARSVRGSKFTACLEVGDLSDSQITSAVGAGGG